MKILLILLFPWIAQSGLDINYRKVQCEAFLMMALQDKTVFYLYPGKSVTSRMSLNRGEDEIFLTIDHNMISDSKISAKDYHYGTKASPDVQIKVAKKFKMKDLETSFLEIQIPTKNSSKTATIRCRIVPK
jgi:hypothetical protein